MSEKGDVQVPGGGNEKADPTSLGVDKARKSSASNDAKLPENYTPSFLGPAPASSTLGRPTSSTLGTPTSASLTGGIPGSILGRVQGQTLGGSSFNVDVSRFKDKARQTERIGLQRDMRGGGAKSGLRPKEKNNSAYGRIPYSRYRHDVMGGPKAKVYVGNPTPSIPTMGVDGTGLHLGPFRFLPLEWRGAFPVLRLRQWYSIGNGATFINEEEEQE